MSRRYSPLAGSQQMKSCTKCVYPETVDTIQFNSAGVCNVCEAIKYKQTSIDWAERREELDEIVEQAKARNGRWDCIIPVSFGKDSSYQVWFAVTQLKLRPLLVRYNHMGMRPGIERNKMRVLKKLGVECIEFYPNWNVVKETMRESLMRKGDSCWACHAGIFSFPMHVAVERDIPLIMWGEALNTQQAFFNAEEKESVDELRFNRAVNLGMTADDMYEFLDGRVDKRDLIYHTYPSKDSLNKLGAKSICLGDYVFWDQDAQIELVKRELGWEGDEVENVPAEWDASKIECQFEGVRQWLKFVKRGYGRVASQASHLIRHGHMDRATGAQLAQTYDGKEPASLGWFLQTVGITRVEFYEIALSHVVDPSEGVDPENVRVGKELHDQKDWV
jgi:N-acetyl sugar amidotransferase